MWPQYNQCLFKFSDNSFKPCEPLHVFVQLPAPKGQASVKATKDPMRWGVYLDGWFHPPMCTPYTWSTGERLHASKAQAAPSKLFVIIQAIILYHLNHVTIKLQFRLHTLWTNTLRKGWHGCGHLGEDTVDGQSVSRQAGGCSSVAGATTMSAGCSGSLCSGCARGYQSGAGAEISQGFMFGIIPDNRGLGIFARTCEMWRRKEEGISWHILEFDFWGPNEGAGA